MSQAVRNGFVVFVLALIVIVGGFVYRQWNSSPEDAQPVPLPIGGAFALRDQNGVIRRDTDFRGKLMLVYFGYTYCPDVCPTTLAMMTRALAELGPAADGIVPIFVTVDPERDTPAAMKQYIDSFDPRFVALTGSAAQIAAAAAAYRVYYRKVPEEGGQYTMDHSSAIYLMGRDGQGIGEFDPAIGADALAAGLRRRL